MNRIVITGGAGFVGGSIASYWKSRHSDSDIVVFDNLRRRGSEITAKRLIEKGIKFIHGDVRCADDLFQLSEFDLMIECSAEPSVLAGYHSPQYMISTNLEGTINCLELCRSRKADLMFLSTSRVYPYTSLNNLNYIETHSRFEISAGLATGVSPRGISENFPLGGPRTLYGATKLASELIIQEYIAQYGIRAIVNRCGVLCGPWQMGKTDQGFVTYWLAQHLFKGKLSYIGYEGSGKQVRDILHVDDLCRLIEYQCAKLDSISGSTFNVGGGAGNSISLVELTDLCRKISAKEIAVGKISETRSGDVRYYVTDNSVVEKVCGWKPEINVESILTDILKWLAQNRAELEPLLVVR